MRDNDITFSEATAEQLSRLLAVLDGLSPAAIHFLLGWTTGECPSWLAEYDLKIFEERHSS